MATPPKKSTTEKTTAKTAPKTTTNKTTAKKTAATPAPEVEAVDPPAVEPEDDAGEADELSAEDELDLARLGTALATLDEDGLRRGLAGMKEKSRQDLATQLNLPRAAMHLGDALVPLVRRKLPGLSRERQFPVATSITERCNDSTIQALGARHDDPSREDLEEVLPALIEEHGVGLVRLMLAGYSVSDAQCRPVMRDLLTTDERFAMPEIPEGEAVATELPSFGLVARVPKAKAGDDPSRAELLEQRKAAKAERRAAARHERAARATAQASRREALHAAKQASKRSSHGR